MRKLLIIIIPTILIITFGVCFVVHKDKDVAKVETPQQDVVQKNTEIAVYEEANIDTVEEVDNNDQKTDKSEIKVEEKKQPINTQKQSTTQVKKQETKKESSIVKTETKKQEDNIAVPEQKEETTTEEKTQEEKVPEKQEEQKEETKEETKEEVTDEKEEVPQVKDEYKRNNTMIEQMKNVIINNESDVMKELGYTIVVDSSIITETNQFTFTEYRLKNKIINRFGTIRIYAQDYYYCGQYMYTECYIM